MDKKKSKNADFKYLGLVKFDTNTDINMLEYEKLKYKKAILPMIQKLEKEISSNKEEKPNNEEYYNFLLKNKIDNRYLKIKYENEDVYPKKVVFPDIYFIQYSEPHILLTDLYDKDKDWYSLREIIKIFAEEAFLLYEMGFWFSSIASVINCCEYILKYEYLRYLNKIDSAAADNLIKNRYFTLGTFVKQGNDYLAKLRIKKYYNKIDYLNLVRSSIYHFNPEKAKKANKKGVLEIEKVAPITDRNVIPIVAYRVYNIMIELINHFYNKKKSLDYYKEGIKDWMYKRGLTKKNLK